eukprot:TRINITY_DN3382_c0_g1_i3.p1 TRINITY_DN3382_c0_g1~~TRINITY_DN3382_c0_g1_i3.p1  ORF type:complete len:341 (-),score=80.28 TRINITY_DN3382_c0_g1_i3:805-1767(-)
MAAEASTRSTSVLFVGDTARDKDGESFKAGGGVFYGAIACANAIRTGGGKPNVYVYTKCLHKDQQLYVADFTKAGLRKATFLQSTETTQCEHFFPKGTPDERVTRAETLADPFTRAQITGYLQVAQEEAPATLHGPLFAAIVVSPLYYGVFPEELIDMLKPQAGFIVADAQGFVRRVEDGIMVNRPWPKIAEWLPRIDLFKCDRAEGELLTGETDMHKITEVLHTKYGANDIIGTCQDGVVLSHRGKQPGDAAFYQAQWTGEPNKWTAEGRCGRGDTVTAGYVAALMLGKKGQQALEFAAKVCSAKLKRGGPYWGEPLDG